MRIHGYNKGDTQPCALHGWRDEIFTGRICVTTNNQTIDTLRQDNERLQQRIAELEHENTTLKQAVDVHRQGEAQLQAILDSMTDNVLVWDGHYDYLYANQAAIDHVGTTRDKVIGKNMRDGLGHIPEFMRLWMQRVDHVLATNEPLHLEDVAQVGENTVYSESVLYPMRDAENRPVAVALVYRDVTERKQQEAELRLFKLIVEHANDAIGFTDTQGIIRYSNAAHRALFGYGDEIVGMHVAATVSPEGGALLETGMQEVLEEGKWRGESINQHKDGSAFPVEVSIFTVQDDHGSIQGMVGVVRDITERKQQEAELRMFKLLVENAPVLISVAGIDLRYRYFNPAFRKHMCIPDDVTPQDFTILDMSPPEMAEPLRQIIPQIIEQGGWKGRSVFRRQDGSTFPGDLAVFVTRDAQDNPDNFIAIANDASEQVAAEEERATLQQQLIDAQRDALRELSTPLIPISDDVVIMPLIGSIDSGRAQMIMETLLEGVAHYQAELVILDITGVQIVDTQVAQAFIQAAQAVRLLGAQVMLTGIQPQIAQTLVHLGVDLGGLQTAGSLQAGIATALKQ